MDMIKNIIRNSYDLIGWHTNKKIVVIESDDWGSIRMPSKAVFDSIPIKYKKNYNSPYYFYDTIASPKDLEMMFETLSSVKDKNGREAVLTANCIMVNPDFEKIRKNNFSEYSYEYFTKTLDNYHGKETFKLWNQGISGGFFKPQLHGREHVDVVAWMEKLKNKDEMYLDAFHRRIFSVNHDLKGSKKNLTTSLDSNSLEESLLKARFVKEAADIFKNIFGFYSTTFIAPSFTWNSDIERALSTKGVKFLQGIHVQKVPTSMERVYKYKKNYLGKTNNFNQHYIIRNVIFEPSIDSSKYGIDSALSRVKRLFMFKKPAIISTHRLNFVGSLDQKNRDNNLKLFRKLLFEIMKKWPDVEFMSTNQLGEMIG